MADASFSREQALAAVQALAKELNQDEQGKALMVGFLDDPKGVANPLAEWLQVHSATMPTPIATYVSGGQVEKLVNIAQAGIVLIQHAPHSFLPHGPTLWNVPYQRNPYFTGRETVLQSLHDALTSTETTPVPPQALCGLAGIGKTQIALEYAYRYQHEYKATFWIRADSSKLLASDFASLASLLDLPEKNEPDQLRIIAAVRTWLNTYSSWLLIFDNVEDLAALKDVLPTAGNGHILLTTLSSSQRRVARRIVIDKMDSEEAIHLLLRPSNFAALESISEKDRAASTKILEMLDGHALALDQAGAYIEETNSSVSDYLHLYETRRAELLKERRDHAFDHPESVLTTWSLSFKKIGRTNPVALEMLKFLAFLHPDAIPEELLTEGGPYLGPILKPAVTDLLKLNATIKELLKYSLIKRNDEAKTFSMHRLVQAVLIDQMSEETQRRWTVRTVQAVNAVYQDPEFTRWERYWLYLPQAHVCAALIHKWQMISPDATLLLGRAASYLENTFRYTEAEQFVKQAIETLFENTPNPDPLEVAVKLSELAELYRNQGKYAEAEPLYQRALAIHEKVLGAEHPDTASSLNNLATLYDNQGKYAEAEPLYQRTLAIYEKVLGPEHPDTASSLNNLAVLYDDQGKYTEAEALYQRALAIHEQVLGVEHPDAANSLNGLAGLYHEQGKYTEAEPLFQRALAIREKVLGAEHPDTATSVNGLAGLYHEQGKYVQVEMLYKETLLLFEKSNPGLNSLKAVKILSDLAYLYYDQDRYTEAEPLYKQALEISSQMPGDRHNNVAFCLNNLAALYDAQGMYAEAEPLYRRALSIREHVLGYNHPDVVLVLENLANLLRMTKRKKEAAALEKRIKAISTT